MTENITTEKKTYWFPGIKLSEAVLIAVVPITAQIILFVYEAGYFSVFKIPVTLISFDIGDLFVAIAAILTIASTVYYLADLFLSSIESTSEPVREKLLRIYGGIIIFFVFFFAYGPQLWKEWIGFLLGVILMLLAEFAWPVMRFRSKSNYTEKLRAHAEIRTESDKKNEGNTLVAKIFKLIGPGGFFFLLLLFCVYHVGRAAAMRQQDFRVASTTPESVVLWMGDDRFIVAPFNRISKLVEPSFQILLVGVDPTISFHLQKVGPLSLNSKVITSAPLPSVTPTMYFTNTPTPTFTQTITITPTPTVDMQTPTFTVTVSPPTP